MARAAVKAKQQARAKAQPPKARAHGRRRHASGGNPNQALFFSRLRRRAKFMYVLLAVLFAATFAFVGVGTGTNSGLDQLFSGIFGGGGGGTSVSKAQKEIKTNPAKGYRDLATAYEQKNDTTDAVAALESYVALRKKDAGAWSELGGLQLQQAQQFVTQYQQAAAIQQQAAPSQAFLPGGSLGTALGSNPIEQAAAQATGGVTSSAYQSALSAYQSSLTSYKKAAALRPSDANAQFQLATAAQNAGAYATAVSALKRYLALSPGTTQKAQIERLIKQLQAAATAASPTTSTTKRSK